MVSPVRKQRPMTADDYLRLALHTGSPDAAAVYAEKGLRFASDRVDAETRVLLLREIYRSHLYARRVRSAHAVARKMVRLGVAQEIAHVDLGRACLTLGWWFRAAQSYRIAARNAPASRRALHWFSVGIALHHAGETDESLSALDRAVRWSLTTRALHRAYAALVRLDAGELPSDIDDLRELVSELESARCGEGFGRYVLGLLYAACGERRSAMKHLIIFVRRNQHDPMRAVTLAHELRRARLCLRSLRKSSQSPSTPPMSSPTPVG